MQAVRITQYGGPEVLTYDDIPPPTIAAGEVLVKVHATSVNPVDRAVRAGYMQQMGITFPFPLTLGIDVAGIVEAVGEGVTRLAVGDSVYGASNLMRQGTYAEYAVLGENEIAPKPASLDFVGAASVPLAGLTAWQSLKAADLQSGQTVLIHGAGGGVGSFAVQFATERGARVVGTAAGDKLDLLRVLGVAEAIDYTKTRFEDIVHDVDVVLSNVAGDVLERSLGVLKRGGVLVTPAGQIDATMAEARGVRAIFVMMQASVSDLTEIAVLIDAGRVKPIVNDVLPLAEATVAHQRADHGHARGKTVLRVIA